MFADGFVVLLAAHFLADYPGQTDRQATRKAGWVEGEDDAHPGRHHHGWGANAVHAATHVGISLALLVLAALALPELHLHPVAVAAALGWVGLSHSVIDRRWMVRWWMEHTGQRSFLANGGAAHVDQAAHIGLGLLPAALLLAAL